MKVLENQGMNLFLIPKKDQANEKGTKKSPVSRLPTNEYAYPFEPSK